MLILMTEYNGTKEEFEKELMKWYGITFNQMPSQVQKLYSNLV